MSLRVFEELRESCTEVIFAFQRRHLVVETSFSGLILVGGVVVAGRMAQRIMATLGLN